MSIGKKKKIVKSYMAGSMINNSEYKQMIYPYPEDELEHEIYRVAYAEIYKQELENLRGFYEKRKCKNWKDIPKKAK